MIGKSRKEASAIVEEQTAELVYRELFLRDLARMQIQDTFYPIRGAANYSLLYLILRLLSEFRFQSVLELGCGQSTILIDRIRQQKTTFSATSIEHDPFWSQEIQAEVTHTIQTIPLKKQVINRRTTSFYDVGHLKGPYDLIIVDGPNGTPRRSRWGALEIIEHLLADDFVLLFDDAERRGERDTIAACRRLLTRRNVNFIQRRTKAKKWQHILCSPTFKRATYL